jgi:hypothetical protein
MKSPLVAFCRGGNQSGKLVGTLPSTTGALVGDLHLRDSHLASAVAITAVKSGGLSQRGIVAGSGSLGSRGIRATTPLPVFRP